MSDDILLLANKAIEEMHLLGCGKQAEILTKLRDCIEPQDREIAELKRRLARWESAPVVGWKIWHPTSSMPAELNAHKARADEAKERGLHVQELIASPTEK